MKTKMKQKVFAYNKENLRPGLSAESFIIKTISLTPETLHKLTKLQKKYKIGKSALVRILVDTLEA